MVIMGCGGIHVLLVIRRLWVPSRWVWQHSFVEIDREIFSVVIQFKAKGLNIKTVNSIKLCILLRTSFFFFFNFSTKPYIVGTY